MTVVSRHGIDLVVMRKQGWIEEMSSYVKSIDGNHLLEAGLEGFYGESRKEANTGFAVGTDFITNYQMTGIDFVTVHTYSDIWSVPISIME